MKNILLATATVLAWVTACPVFAEDAIGNWSGAIDGHLISLVHIERAVDGHLTGTFASHEAPLAYPDATALRSAITDVVAADDHLHFIVPGNGGIFDGQWNPGQKAWAGTFQWGKGGYRSTLSLARTDMTSLPAEPSPTLYSRPEDEVRALDKLVQAFVAKGRFMGSVLVSQNGRILLDKGYGFADAAGAVPDTPQTHYRIGSITKQFTAAAILLLQDRGKLRIGDPVKAYLPETPASWDHITLYNLLTHTSGLVRDTDLGSHGLGDDRPEHLLALLRDKPLLFVPGEQISYSNAGYDLLGLIIEKVSGETYGDFLRDTLFVPLDMTQSAFNPGADPKLAVGFESTLRGPVPIPTETYADLYASGGIVTTTHDFALWQSALFGGKVLSPVSLKTMITPFKNDYGTGVEITKPFGHVDINHGGGVPGFESYAYYELDDGLSVIVLGNNHRATADIAKSLLAIARGLPGQFPPEPVAVPEATLQRYVGTYAVSPDLKIVVTLKDGQLMAQTPQTPVVPIYAQSETVFYTDLIDGLTLEFATAADGSVNAVLHWPGRPDMSGKRQ